jgi:hypothetical protein
MISNKMIAYLTALVLVAMGVLFILNIEKILHGQTGSEIYLKYNDVAGIGVKHKGLTYTLNFDQQNKMVELLNHSLKVTLIDSGNRQTPDIEQIVIYRLEGKAPLTLLPVAYVDEQLIYSNEEWNAGGYLKDVSNGSLKKLLAETYDH